MNRKTPFSSLFTRGVPWLSGRLLAVVPASRAANPQPLDVAAVLNCKNRGPGQP